MDIAMDVVKRAEKLENEYIKFFDSRKDSVQHIEGLPHVAFEKFSVYQPTKLTYSAGVR